MDTLLGFLPFVGSPGLPELLIIGIVILLLFGKRLPGAMKSLGTSIVEFKKGIKGDEEEDEAGSGRTTERETAEKDQH